MFLQRSIESYKVAASVTSFGFSLLQRSHAQQRSGAKRPGLMRLVGQSLSFSPTDLNAFLACEHLTTLQLAAARGELAKPWRHNPHADLIRRKGDEHEAAYLARLQADGRDVTTIDFDDRDWERAAHETEDAIRNDADVVYQAALTDGTWRGFADFIERRADGDGYEVVDTKLARLAKPQHVLQLCFYTEQLARIQGHAPEAMHVVTGLGEPETFRPDDFFAYYRRLRQRFLDAVEQAPATYPYPVDYCGLCDFLALCKERWAEDDHLTLVAGMSRLQVERLRRPASRRSRGSPARARPQGAEHAAPTFEGSATRPAPAPLPRTGEYRMEDLPRSPSAASRSCPSRPRATSGSTSRATRGSSRGAGSSTSSAGSSSASTASRATSNLGAGPADREARASSSSSTTSSSAAAACRAARLPLRAVRAHRALAPHGRARDA